MGFLQLGYGMPLGKEVKDSHSRMFENKAGVTLRRTAKCKPYPDLPMTMEYERWSIGLSLPMCHERLDYERGAIDTVATQNPVLG